MLLVNQGPFRGVAEIVLGVDNTPFLFLLPFLEIEKRMEIIPLV